MNAGAATWIIPTARRTASAPRSVTRMPGASSGPSQPTACGSPCQRREAWVRLNASAPPALDRRATSTAAAGETTATIAGDEHRRADHRHLEHDRDERVGGAAARPRPARACPTASAWPPAAGGGEAPATSRAEREHEHGRVALGGQQQRDEPGAWIAAATRSTRGCPSRSISRPWATAPNALASPKAATTRPAEANEPVVSRASSRIASPNIPIGSAPSAEATSGARASGRRSSARVAAQALQGAPSSVSRARLRSGPPP